METINLYNPQNMEVTLTDVAQAARQAANDLVILDDRLLTLRLSFGKLRSAIENAFAPVTASLAPMLNSAIRALTDFCDGVGAVLAALFGTVYEKAVTTTKAAGSAIRRTLASFDQIERLNGGGGGGGGTTVTLEPINDALTPSLQKVVDFIRAVMAKIAELLAPLKRIDLTPAAEAFGRLGQTLLQLGATIGSALEWAWYNILVPLATWAIEELVPASVDMLTEAFKLLAAVLPPLIEGIKQLLPALQPIARFIGETLILFIQSLGRQFGVLAQSFTDNAPRLQAVFSNLVQIIQSLWSFLEPVLLQLRSGWLSALDTMGSDTAGWITRVTNLLYYLTEFVSGVLTGDWSRAWGGMKEVLRGALNGIIALANSLLSALATALNGISSILGSWQFTVPEWVPQLGGKRYSFSVGRITAPQIPYLARGAVLPAGKPFLAMVGDQRHGTNIEAPLSTIQEAVAIALEDLTRGNMAGHEATVQLLEQILASVRSIRIGDDTIADAADRSHSRLAVMKGAAYAR